jgi:ATP-dependent Clp protease ATP-binding subunit ClpA
MHHSDRHTLELADIAAVLHERTGIPAETLLGCGDETDFAAALSAAVVGQPNAVETAARELRLIKAGLSAPGKPASVMLFAGLTGVGKTELAKRIAEVYSTSRRLQVYSMGNFTEPHSVSGLIGVPPGYVGHDQGGRLINDLNADPYSVFLLDEAEKCHPNIWKPFLNLFDEGWIADQRGVKAHADRAIFILTTNAGDRHIAQLAEAGKSEDEIAEAVRQTLSRIRLERSTQPVFPPQFLSRIRRIVVFRPLDEDAMIAIAQHACQRLINQWRQKRETAIEIAPEVPEAIGRLAHQLNQASHQQEGGRVIQKLIDQLLQDGLQSRCLSRQHPPLSAGQAIHVELAAGDSPAVLSIEDLRVRLRFV